MKFYSGRKTIDFLSTLAFFPTKNVHRAALSTMASEEPHAKKPKLSEEKDEKTESLSKKTPSELR